MNKLIKITIFTILVFGSLFFLTTKAQAYSNNNMVDSTVFDSKNSMSEQEIRNFINSRPNTCLTRVGANLGGGNIYPRPVTYFSYGPTMTDAAGVIYEAAQYNDINPKVILSTLQKEQSLLTDNDCYDPQGFASLPKAMGYGCFEGPGAACPPAAYAGFHQQVMKGAWQLAFDRHRAEGNTSWGGNDSINYGGRMTQGVRKRCASCSSIYYDGYSIIDGQNTYIENGGTAALFNYTPHLNQSFPSIFETFFGSGSTSAYPTGVVYRAYRVSNGEHLYSASSSEINSAKGLGFVYEGPAWANSTDPQAIPVYRLYNRSTNKHFYTINTTEIATASTVGYVNEGPAWAALTFQKAGSTPVYRAYRRTDNKHLFTASPVELNSLQRQGFVYEGVAWYSK